MYICCGKFRIKMYFFPTLMSVRLPSLGFFLTKFILINPELMSTDQWKSFRFDGMNLTKLSIMQVFDLKNFSLFSYWIVIYNISCINDWLK